MQFEVQLENNSVEVEQSSEFLMARELASPGGPLTKIFGAIAALAFIGGGLFFGLMPTEVPLAEDWWLRLLLGGGLIVIGLAIGWSNFSPTTHVTQFTMDMCKRVLAYGPYSVEDGFVPTGTVGFAAINQFYAGSQLNSAIDKTGTTALYIEAEGGPHNGALLVGSVIEMELLARVANSILANTPMHDRPADTKTPPPGRGFGRRGL